MADTWKGPIGWLTERLTRPGKKKKDIKEISTKTKSGWGSTKDIILKRKREQEELLKESGGLRNAYRKAKGG